MSLDDDIKISGLFPALITPKKPLSLENFLAVIKTKSSWIKQKLLQHGALLFRHFEIKGASDFEKVVSALSLGEFVNYIGGDSPRDKITKHVYTSTEAPPNFHIPLHQELSFIKHHPRHIYFYCDLAPKVHGETIIGDARKVYASLAPHIKDIFSQQFVTYISHYYHQSRFMRLLNKWQRSHKSWIEVFETDDKNEVEKKCVANEFAWQWLNHGWLEIRQTRPAIIKHPETQEWIWFNQAHLYDFNPRLLGLKNYLGAQFVYFKKTARLHEVEFENGHKIKRADLYHIMDVLEKETVAFPWQTGDLMVLDNMLAMHGRAPFSGRRRVLTAMTS